MTKVMPIVVGELDTNCYLVYSEQSENALVVDPGGDYDKIVDCANQLNKKIKAVLLTHAHFDHTLEVHKFKANGASVYMHKTECEVLNSSANLSAYFGVELKPFIVDNQLIAGLFDIFGYSVQVIETPGHTKGSVCFIIEDYLFSGDTLFAGSFGRIDFPTGNGKQLLESIKSLYALKGDYILLSGHGEASTLNYERKNNPAVDYLGKIYG